MKIFRHLLLGTALVATIHNGLIAETITPTSKRNRQASRRSGQAVAGLDRAAFDRGREPQLSGGRGVHGEARARRGIPAGDRHQHRRQAGRLRHARCRRAEDGRPLLHVRREAVRSGGMDVAAARSARSSTSRGFGKAIVGRGAVNQKGPESAFLAALHAIRGAGKKMPVNLVMVAEGEEEIGSPHIGQLVHRPEVEAALAKMRRRLHALRVAGSRRHRHGQPRRERRGRAGAGVERREVGTRSGEGHPLVAQSDGRQPGVASGESARHARLRRRQHDHDRQLSRSRVRSAPRRRR